ncbi:hypothetical protein [Candidatus Methylacidiphilum fumarolicum]|uniref:Uncharacterized protein n=1 Tax=Candidatus Methylacidiphilum fumarolicum TaxID=591154 RepID=A0ABN8XH45_9BACT|nr:hypothetical protein [Candidatus Methylacidiphilum fumarolicum]CAI9086415.1 protein of unknown function [Candidatus Methylacidiphilum fumarolicum]
MYHQAADLDASGANRMLAHGGGYPREKISLAYSSLVLSEVW